jgi:hypothetical protein
MYSLIYTVIIIGISSGYTLLAYHGDNSHLNAILDLFSPSEFQVTPTVVRISDTENLVIWESNPEEIYTLHWSREPEMSASGGSIENVTSPFVHAVGNNEQPIYYSVSDENSLPGPEGFSLTFSQADIERRMLLGIGDVNHDGCIEVLGTLNDCEGNLMVFNDADIGLETLTQDSRNYRDARLADFNGDGTLDVVSNSYNIFGPDAPQAQLHIGNGDGTFTLDPDFYDIDAKGYGETIVVADFDNDNDLDIFLPYYSYSNPAEQSYLLLNDGFGKFVDVADNVGVALRNVPNRLRVEGAQAIDLEGDGDIDLVAASHLFINQLSDTGRFVFLDDPRMPVGFEEGLKFLDWNNDGLFDLLKQAPHNDEGPQLYENTGDEFVLFEGAFPPDHHQFAYGLNSADVNNDGLIDVLSSGGYSLSDDDKDEHYPHLFINTGSGFLKHKYLWRDDKGSNDISAFADFDGNGTMDFVARFGYSRVFLNQGRSTNAIVVRMLGPNGELNQHGRIIRVIPEANPRTILSRVVDGGSGYLANNQYDVIVGLPYSGRYSVEARYRSRVVRVRHIKPGHIVTLSENGFVSQEPIPPIEGEEKPVRNDRVIFP